MSHQVKQWVVSHSQGAAGMKTSAVTVVAGPLPADGGAKVPPSWCPGSRRQSSIRRSAAQRDSSWRLESCSLRSTAETCASTVLAEICSRSAISLYM